MEICDTALGIIHVGMGTVLLSEVDSNGKGRAKAVMRILYPAAYFHPENIASSHLEKDLLQVLTDAGHEVEVVCPTPTRGISDEVWREYRCRREETLYGGKVHVCRFWAPREGKNSLIRAFRYFWCVIRTVCVGWKAREIDVILAASTPPIQGLAAGWLKRTLKCPFVYNLQDIFPDSLVYTGLAGRDSILWKIGRRVEDATYWQADQIVTISEDFRKNILAKGVPPEKISVIDNWINEGEAYAIDREENPLFDQYGLPRDKFYVAYSGNIGHSQNMDMLLDTAASLLEREDIGFIIVGDGACRPHVAERVREESLKNVALLPYQPYEDIAKVFSLGDVALLISKSGIGQNSVPSKTWGYMAAGRPVLASFDTDSLLSCLLDSERCGVCIEPDSPEALRTAILSLAENRESLREMGIQGRQYILDNLTAKIGTGKWLALLESLVGHRGKTQEATRTEEDTR